MHNKARNVFILGSCVSRDALEGNEDLFAIRQYVARTSMASFGLDPVSEVQVRDLVASLQSPFQRRMLFNDLDKTTGTLLAGNPHDILLLDFIDERFKLVLAGNTCFSLSGELEHAGFQSEGRVLLTPDSEEFLTLWLAGVSRLLGSVDRSKLVINRAFWAEKFEDGSDASSIRWIKDNNEILSRLYDALEKHWSLRYIDYPESVVRADPNHRWGKAPYHFTQTYYDHTVAELAKITQRQ
ncbi:MULTISPECIES: DUF6270 domain-containing protein [unclassified Pseudoxanthomonas]|uniref:DUF6270 domain-containing protein n=1 Tax=unclassified Pseudoxanthomonas TaxID=2645906 RepID=UPI001C6600F0|nr:MULTISPECIES: DUF6270 domain-containing protein [unclassified Pseudoxanthomonas]